jgi:regulator of sigma E protease
MSGVLSVVVVVVAIVGLVVLVVGFHELGHFVCGKLFGIRVDEFSIGFGKRLFARQRGETTYSIRAIPLGGYVKMAGMLDHPREADAGARNFYRASIPKRLITLLAGIVFNILLAGILYTTADLIPTSSLVVAGGPAANAGISNGDSIIAIDGKQVDHSSLGAVQTTVHNAVDATDGRNAVVTYADSSGGRHSTTITPQLGVINYVIRPSPCDGNAIPVGDNLVTALDGHAVPTGPAADILKDAHTVDGIAQSPPCNGQKFTSRTLPAVAGGSNSQANVRASWRIGMNLDYRGMPLGSSFADGWGQIPQFFSDEYSGLKELFTNSATGGPLGANGFEGPIGIGAEGVQQTQAGLAHYVAFVALISMNLAIVNVLPIPFLDGGKALLVAIEGIRRKRLDARRELAIYAVGAAFIVIFALYVTIGDIRRILH